MNQRAQAVFERGRSEPGRPSATAPIYNAAARPTRKRRASGETATVLLQHTLNLNALTDPDFWPWIIAYFWPLIVLPMFRVLRSARALTTLRVAEVLLLSYSAFCLGTVLLIARPELGFYLGALGIFTYAIGMARGIPQAVMRRAAAWSGRHAS